MFRIRPPDVVFFFFCFKGKNRPVIFLVGGLSFSFRRGVECPSISGAPKVESDAVKKKPQNEASLSRASCGRPSERHLKKIVGSTEAVAATVNHSDGLPTNEQSNETSANPIDSRRVDTIRPLVGAACHQVNRTKQRPRPRHRCQDNVVLTRP